MCMFNFSPGKKERERSRSLHEPVRSQAQFSWAMNPSSGSAVGIPRGTNGREGFLKTNLRHCIDLVVLPVVPVRGSELITNIYGNKELRTPYGLDTSIANTP